MTAPHTVAGHTAGPFAVHPEKAWIVCSQLDDAGEPCPVAALAWPTKYRSEAETLANGHLFAAAPDLLASLIELLEPLERASAAMVADGKALNEAGEAAFDRARAAIAKATAARQSNDMEGESSRG